MFNRVWNHYFHHPFWRFPPIFGNTHISTNHTTENHTFSTRFKLNLPGSPPMDFLGKVFRPLRGPPTYSSCEVVAPWAPWNQDHSQRTTNVQEPELRVLHLQPEKKRTTSWGFWRLLIHNPSMTLVDLVDPSWFGGFFLRVFHDFGVFWDTPTALKQTNQVVFLDPGNWRVVGGTWLWHLAEEFLYLFLGSPKLN